jgi:polyhydroxyalkanoate synthesis regulator phasin
MKNRQNKGMSLTPEDLTQIDVRINKAIDAKLDAGFEKFFQRLQPIFATFATKTELQEVTVSINSLRHDVNNLGDAVGFVMQTAATKADITELKSEIADIKSDVAILKSDVNILKSDVRVLRLDVSALKSDVQLLNASNTHLEAGYEKLSVGFKYLLDHLKPTGN